MTRYVAKFTYGYMGYFYIEMGYFYIDIDAWSSDEAELIGQQIADNLRADFLGIE
jgi:hypothetical protein